MVDRQIRSLFEYEIKHRAANNFGFLWMIPLKFFVHIEYWYGAKLVNRRNLCLFRKKYANIYDSYVMFDDFLERKGFDVKARERERERERDYSEDSVPNFPRTPSPAMATAAPIRAPKRKPWNIFSRRPKSSATFLPGSPATIYR
jgi:hypothetical protein